MPFDYSQLVSVAKSLVLDFGKTVNLIKQSTQPADPQKPWRGNDQIETITPVNAVIIPIEERTIELQNALQRTASSVAYVASVDGFDVRGVHFLDESVDVRWRVVDITTYSPGSSTLLYALFLAR